MQVNNGVNARYYATYSSNRNTKYCSGIFQTNAGTVTSDETTAKQEFTQFAEYQEFHRARLSQGRQNNVLCSSTTPRNLSKYEDITKLPNSAVSIAESEDAGEFLGLTMVPEEGQTISYGLRAMLSEKGTADNPIVQVVSNLGGEKVIYNVEVNKVNPSSASQLEMFALLSYTDKMGITDGGTFGSHQQLEVYGANACSLGYCNSFSGADAFVNEKIDWSSVMKKMVKVYQDAAIDKQAQDCKTLADFFDTVIAQLCSTNETA